MLWMLSTSRAKEHSGMQPCQTEGDLEGTWALMCWWVMVLILHIKVVFFCTTYLMFSKDKAGERRHWAWVERRIGETLGEWKKFEGQPLITWIGECWCEGQPRSTGQFEHKSSIFEVFFSTWKQENKCCCQNRGWTLDAHTTFTPDLCPQRIMGSG